MRNMKRITLIAAAVAATFGGLIGQRYPAVGRATARFLEPHAQDLVGLGAAFAVENHKSTIVTNADATPVDLSSPLINHGRLREQVAKKEIAAADDDNTVLRLFRVWSGWRISSIEIASDALSTGAAWEVGVHQTAENGGAVVDADEFASGVDLAAAKAMTDVTYEAAATEIDKIEMPLWERIGLTEDPKRWYDITMTATAAGTAAGTIAARLRYVDGT